MSHYLPCDASVQNKLGIMGPVAHQHVSFLQLHHARDAFSASRMSHTFCFVHFAKEGNLGRCEYVYLRVIYTSTAAHITFLRVLLPTG